MFLMCICIYLNTKSTKKKKEQKYNKTGVLQITHLVYSQIVHVNLHSFSFSVSSCTDSTTRK